MAEVIITCVRTGQKYSTDYVYKLRAMAARHLASDHRFICLTDRPGDLEGVETEDITERHLPGWWGKLALFDFAARSSERVLYFDLDTVIAGDLAPLAALDVEFGICANFTRKVLPDYPCRYGSCVMSFAAGFGGRAFGQFMARPAHYISHSGIHGDQKVIEELAPDAILLQEAMPAGFFLGYRELASVKPANCSVVVFAGKSKPHNCKEKWIKAAWAS